MPPHLTGYLARWRELHPGWEFTLWSDDTLPVLRHQRFVDDPARWSPKSNPGQYKANLVRYELLYDLGGVWVDCDLEPLRPIDRLIDGATCFAAWETQDVWVNNAFIGCTTGHPAMGEIVDGIPESIVSKSRKRSTWQTGPRYVTPILAERLDVTVFDQRLIYPYRWDQLDRADGEFPGAYAVHHWSNRRRGQPPPARR
jgi:inositol phosphorylceramide mannosyltransferase catalytic subunit